MCFNLGISLPFLHQEVSILEVDFAPRKASIVLQWILEMRTQEMP